MSISADGSVKGKWFLEDLYINSGKKDVLHGEVTCFTICDDEKTVWLGGIITKNDYDKSGCEAFWTVMDNGKGKGAPVDMATDLTFCYWGSWFPPGSGVAEKHCLDGSGETTMPLKLIDKGEIKVQAD